MKKPIKNADYEAVRVEEGFGLLNKKTKAFYKLGTEFMLVWSLCDGKNTVDDIVKKITGDRPLPKGVTEEMIKEDVEKILDLLKENDLVR
ncbi:MAG TPA: PqqD family protein [Candidatus Aenigmarchaeota archaeon]|nr:PqqD family protein [Candidatus Aenigmarchaeota archaeon]